MITLLDFILVYGLIGLIWSCWLEYFTTKNLEAPFNEPWVMYERIYHVVLWPYALSVFIYQFLKEYFKNKQ